MKIFGYYVYLYGVMFFLFYEDINNCIEYLILYIIFLVC